MPLVYRIVPLLFPLVMLAQAPDTVWTKIYGGGFQDMVRSVEQTSDNGYIATGNTASFGAGGNDFWLIKTNASGDTLWTRTYGGIENDIATSVQQTTDGGYIATGYTASFGAGGNDLWLIKTDALGDTLWTRIFGGTGNDVAQSVRQTTDGGYIVAGFTGSLGANGVDFWLIKTNASGDTLWTRTYGGIENDIATSVQQTTDGGYIATGYTASFGAGGNDLWLIKTDAAGDALWTRTYGGSAHDNGWAVQQTTDGGYIITGDTHSYGAGGSDLWIIKTDASGNVSWTKTYGDTGSDKGFSVTQVTNDGFIVAGYTDRSPNRYAWLLRTDASGDTLWSITIGEGINNGLYSVQQTTDGGYIASGFTATGAVDSYDGWLIRVAGETPAAPANLTATPGDQAVTFTWNANSETDFLRYRIYGGTGTAPTTQVDSTTGGNLNDTTATITGLSNGTTYYYRITAVDSAGNESDYSAEVSVTPAAPLAGTYLIDKSGAGDFDSFSAAVSELNTIGISAPVAFLVKKGGDGIYNEQISINAISG